MNRMDYFNFIESRLSTLTTRIEMRGSVNLLDMHVHAETFYLYFLGLLFGWNLKNLNAFNPNAAGVDLEDAGNRIVVQVSATATKHKVESALAKAPSRCRGYFFKFISISRNAAQLRNKTFLNPLNLAFSPANDILDTASLLAIISSMDIDRLREVYEFLKKELRSEPDSEKVESNLAAIITLLSKEDWHPSAQSYETKAYDIETKISYNHLEESKALIEDYKIHYSRIDTIYSDFDKQGANKSLSILAALRREYLTLCTTCSPDQCFLAIIEKVIQKVHASANFTPIPEEELELCVHILVVDAFIRCKIFQNPMEHGDAHS